MKKKNVIWIAILAVCVLLVACGTLQGNSGIGLLGGAGQQARSTVYITEAQAKSIALSHAGVAKADIQWLRVSFDRDDGRNLYEVDFISGGKEYNYDVDAVSGEIVGYEVEVGVQPPAASVTATVSVSAAAPTTTSTAPPVASTTPPVASTAPPAAPSAAKPAVVQTPPSGLISAEQAKSIALSHAGVASTQVSYIYAHLDYDDGRTVYEVEFSVGAMEYDYDIDAVTGNILSFDQDHDGYHD